MNNYINDEPAPSMKFVIALAITYVIYAVHDIFFRV